jgi:hypothetical protein
VTDASCSRLIYNIDTIITRPGDQSAHDLAQACEDLVNFTNQRGSAEHAVRQSTYGPGDEVLTSSQAAAAATRAVQAQRAAVLVEVTRFACFEASSRVKAIIEEMIAKLNEPDETGYNEAPRQQRDRMIIKLNLLAAHTVLEFSRSRPFNGMDRVRVDTARNGRVVDALLAETQLLEPKRSF